MTLTTIKHDPKLDLVLDRVVDVPPELVWKAWTTPEHLKKWFTPAPWKTVDCKIDLRPGGVFYTVMESPEGEQYPGTGCYLEVVENERLTWTDALQGDFRPAAQPNDCFGKFFTATVIFEPHAQGTRYIVIARHSDEESRQKHEEQGFHDGWNAALDQLVALAKTWR